MVNALLALNPPDAWNLSLSASVLDIVLLLSMPWRMREKVFLIADLFQKASIQSLEKAEAHREQIKAEEEHKRKNPKQNARPLYN